QYQKRLMGVVLGFCVCGCGCEPEASLSSCCSLWCVSLPATEQHTPPHTGCDEWQHTHTQTHTQTHKHTHTHAHTHTQTHTHTHTRTQTHTVQFHLLLQCSWYLR